MKTNHLTRHIGLSLREKDTRKLEDFIEQICDDYHIYDAYYGNILASNTIAFELVEQFSENKEEIIDIYFNSSAAGLHFSISISSCFLEFACLYEKVKNLDPQDHTSYVDEDVRPMMMIRMLSDKIELDNQKEHVTLHFHVTGINELLSIQRIELLEKYYAKILKLQKA